MKRALLLFGGILWALFALGFLALLVEYVAGGAGLQYWIPMASSESILVGLVHLTGLCTASILCFVVGGGLWALGRAPETVGTDEHRRNQAN